MDLKSAVRQEVALALQGVLDHELVPGLSPCFVRAMLEDHLVYGEWAAGSIEAQLIDAVLGDTLINPEWLVSGDAALVWLATRYAHLPLCSHSPWSEVKLARTLSLLRGGLQQSVWVGFRNYLPGWSTSP